MQDVSMWYLIVGGACTILGALIVIGLELLGDWREIRRRRRDVQLRAEMRKEIEEDIKRRSGG